MTNNTLAPVVKVEPPPPLSASQYGDIVAAAAAAAPSAAGATAVSSSRGTEAVKVEPGTEVVEVEGGSGANGSKGEYANGESAKGSERMLPNQYSYGIAPRMPPYLNKLNTEKEPAHVKQNLTDRQVRTTADFLLTQTMVDAAKLLVLIGEHRSIPEAKNVIKAMYAKYESMPFLKIPHAHAEMSSLAFTQLEIGVGVQGVTKQTVYVSGGK
jgi:hypothetical protein